jgi:hypothetical protein
MTNLSSVNPAQAGGRAELKRTCTFRRTAMATMKAAIFVEKNRIVLDDKPIPEVGPLDAALARKLCRVAFALMKNQSKYRSA